jgi:hypothetical protein
MRARRLGLLAALLSLLLTGCVTLPEAGGVGTRPGQEPVDQGAGTYDYTPLGPRPGATPLAIVEDFLLAMQASPQSTAVARKFLTDQARQRWFPEKATLVYGSRLVSGQDQSFHVSLQQTVELDERGAWQGEVGGSDGVGYTLHLVRERGQWRISDPPDALVIPRSYFDSRYDQYFAYFFDPTARILVPEPTYLPRGEQTATLLVRRLLRGPHPKLDGVVRTFIPGGTKYVLSVPVSPEGTAQVDLSEELLRLGEHDRQMALAQLAWTLRQVPGVEAMRVTVGGAPLDIPGAGSPQSVSSWAQFDPSVHWASGELFGIRDGQVVAVDPSGGDLAGRFGGREYSLREVGVDLAGERMAGVTDDGTTVVLAPRGERVASTPGPDRTRVLYDRGTDVLKPAWDVFGDVWLVDRRSDGAEVAVAEDGAARTVEAPGIDGRDVTAFLVSRDGTRLVAVLSRRSGDELVMARVLRGADGKVRGLTPAVAVPMARGSGDRIRDVAWRGPAGLAVLTSPTGRSSQVLMALVDGSTPPADADTAELFHGRAVRVVSSPADDTSLLLQTARGGLYELGADGQWGEARARSLRAPTYVG